MTPQSEDDAEEMDKITREVSRHGGLTGLKKRLWTATEDEILRDYVQKNGVGNWADVSKNYGLSRTALSCKNRWFNYLRPDLNKGPFSEEEERQIVELRAKYGNNWIGIAKELPGRSPIRVREFWDERNRKLQSDGKPPCPSGIVCEDSTGSRGFDILYQHIPGSSTLNLQQEGNFGVPCSDLDVGGTTGHPSLSGLSSSQLQMPPFCLPEGHCPSHPYNSSLQKPGACVFGRNPPLSPIASGDHPQCLIQPLPSYPCQPVRPSPSDGPGLPEYIVDGEKFIPNLEKGSTSPQIADVYTGIVPTMDVNQIPCFPQGGNASSVANAAEEHQSFDTAVDSTVDEKGYWMKLLVEDDEPNDKDNSGADG